MKTAGIVLLILGLGLTIFTSVKFFTREKVVDIGKLEITRDKPNYLSWSPVLGVLVIGLGGVLIWQGGRK